VPCAPVLKRSEVIEHPQVVASDLLIELKHPEAGTIRQTRPAARFSKSTPVLRNGAPALGADTDAILAEINIPEDIINKLKDNGTIA